MNREIFTKMKVKPDTKGMETKKASSEETCKVYEFLAEIKKVPDIDGAYVVFPYDLRKEFGKGRLKVHAEFDGEPYDGSIVNMGIKNKGGSVCYTIGVRKDIRQKINKNSGDKIKVKIRERK